MALSAESLKLVHHAALLAEIGEIGIIFLLFLVGLDLPPSKLKHMLGKAVVTALVSSVVFFGIGFGVMAAFGFGVIEASVVGVACIFGALFSASSCCLPPCCTIGTPARSSSACCGRLTAGTRNLCFRYTNENGRSIGESRFTAHRVPGDLLSQGRDGD